MYDDILVPTDGRPGTDSAVARGLYFARQFDATVHALFVRDTELGPESLPDNDRAAVLEELETRGETAVRDIREWGKDLDIDVVTELREGVPERVITEYVTECDIDLIVMGRRARESDGSYIGSTTQRVLVRAPTPVIAVPVNDGELPEPGYGAFDRVVIPTDGSDVAERAATHGLAVAERYGADVRVVYVVDTTTHELADTSRSILGPLREGGRNALEDIAEEARDRNLPVSTAMLEGTPAEEILQYVDGTGGDFIAMGTHGTGSRSREQLLGSTATRTIRRSTVPVLTVNGTR